MRQFLILVPMMACLCLMMTASAFSQQPAASTQVESSAETPVTPTPDSTPAIKAEQNSASGKKLKFDDAKYVDPTYPNLAKLYWALGILDVNNSRLIDNYLAITECNMYLQYINNDLEWQDVREATRNSLRQKYKEFPTNFKFTIPLYLSRYHPEEEYFEVNEERSAIKSVRNIETVYYIKPVTCGQSSDLEGYPRNLILYLNRPFMLPEVPIERELARLYLDEANAANNPRMMDANRKARVAESEHMAFLEIFFRVHSFKENESTVGGFTKAVVYAQIDYIRVYADYEKHKLLYEKDMFEEENRKRRKRESSAEQDNLALPEGPLFGEPEKKKTAPVRH